MDLVVDSALQQISLIAEPAAAGLRFTLGSRDWKFQSMSEMS
jgi:hypothetical protein